MIGNPTKVDSEEVKGIAKQLLPKAVAAPSVSHVRGSLRRSGLNLAAVCLKGPQIDRLRHGGDSRSRACTGGTIFPLVSLCHERWQLLRRRLMEWNRVLGPIIL